MRKAGGLTSPAFVLYSNEQSELRNKFIDRVDVLNKVKELFLIPKLEMMTTQMVEEFYEANSKAIFQTYMRNQEELVADGVKTIKCSDLRVKLQNEALIKKTKGTAVYYVKLPNRGEIRLNSKSTYFTPRAVLRIGMLLRDSEVAKEVRRKCTDSSHTK